MNSMLYLHWRYRQLEEEAERKRLEAERRAQIVGRIKFFGYWIGIGAGAAVLALSMTKVM